MTPFAKTAHWLWEKRERTSRAQSGASEDRLPGYSRGNADCFKCQKPSLKQCRFPMERSPDALSTPGQSAPPEVSEASGPKSRASLQRWSDDDLNVLPLVFSLLFLRVSSSLQLTPLSCSRVSPRFSGESLVVCSEYRQGQWVMVLHPSPAIFWLCGLGRVTNSLSQGSSFVKWGANSMSPEGQLWSLETIYEILDGLCDTEVLSIRRLLILLPSPNLHCTFIIEALYMPYIKYRIQVKIRKWKYFLPASTVSTWVYILPNSLYAFICVCFNQNKHVYALFYFMFYCFY